MLVNNLKEQVEKAAFEADSIKTHITRPVVPIRSVQGKTTMLRYMLGRIEPFMQVMARTVSTVGHWIQIESAEEVNRILEEFIEELAKL